MQAKTVLIVDDEMNVYLNLSKFISKVGYKTLAASNVKDAKEVLRNGTIDIVISDVVMPGEDGIEFLSYIKEHYPQIKVILITGFTTVEITLRAIKNKVDAFLEKPVTFNELEEELKRITQYETPIVKATEPHVQKAKYIKKYNIIMSPNSPMNDMVKFLEVIADKKASIFIQGESGTGKELVARAIHQISKRNKKYFIAINCGAIPETLMESELFGHTKGSFTGAIADKIGRIEMAHQGTLFLDEAGELSLNMQVKLLRTLQEKEINPVGARKPKEIDFRLISATNVDLDQAVIDRKFREDLYYRINVIPIKIPPLRERKEDIPALTEYFIEKNNQNQGSSISGVTRDAMDYLINYSWPGNIRELQNLIERLSIIKDEGYLESKDLPEKILEHVSPGTNALSTMFYNDQSDRFDFKQMMESYQKEILLYALKRSNWNKKKAAEFLKLKRTTFVEMLKRLNVKPPSE